MFHETKNNPYNELRSFSDGYDNKISDKISNNVKIAYFLRKVYSD